MHSKYEQRQHGLGRGQSGFSLIEALVALVVLSVGMIGIAALYGQGLSAGRTALYRTIAVNLAAEMADRIRANRLGRASYTGAGAARPCGPGGGTNCTPAELAEYDVNLWQALVGQQLPGGVGTVAFAAGTPPTYTIAVTWQDFGGATTYQITPQIPSF
ncbi:MAG: type IV pilus modification protein PilV [Lysobacterales bacterium]|nr:MAG: type IV pilus modification protein PilV [Xanthomonadales bacterium]